MTKTGIGLLALLGALLGCGGGGAANNGGVDGGADGAAMVSPLVISGATRTPRTTTWSLNYWMWAPTFGDHVSGTDTAIARLAPAVLRIGGYNNDANTPDPFDDAQLDKAVAYARAIGAEPLLQVPRIADTSGNPSTPDTAAQMVRYANVTKQYAVKYWSVGNEPDLYDTSGSPANNNQPAFPGYMPADFCTAERAYVTAMKAVDPTIVIVGPDLAYKYQAGYDWLTPILKGCGDLFDVISIHRYPFEAKQAALAAAKKDPAAFRSVVASVRAIMQANGQGAKPLALTEMNVAYDATTCVLDASPGTVGSALWLADSLGAAIDLGLWTSAVWNISDDPSWTLGLIGPTPVHTPRPEYYAYLLFAQHFGPTVLPVASAPDGVSAHASRNADDNATEIIVANWNNAPAGLNVQVTGMAAAMTPKPVTFVVPAVSISAIEVPDDGAARAWTYSEAERSAANEPSALAEGLAGTTTPTNSDGTMAGAHGAGSVVGTGCPMSGQSLCTPTTLTSQALTGDGKMSGNTVSFGSGSNQWGSFTYAAPGQSMPMTTVTSDGSGMEVSASLTPPLSGGNDYVGFGLYYSSTSCVDGAAYTGVRFDIAGDLGTCSLALAIDFSADVSTKDDSARGGCQGTACYGPSADVTASVRAATAAAPTIRVPFSMLTGGMPVAALDVHSIVSVRWQLVSPLGTADGGGGCSANLTVTNAAFY